MVIVVAYRCVEGIAVPVPGVEKLHALALVLCPGVAVSKRGIQSEDRNREGKEKHCCALSNCRVFLETKSAESIADEVIHLAQCQDGEIECWEIMVQEKLAGHEVEGKIVERPSENRHAHLIVETFEGYIGIIAISTLPSENGQTFDGDV